MSELIPKAESQLSSVAQKRREQQMNDRRLFLKSGAALAAAGAMTSFASAEEAEDQAKNSPGERVVMGIMGVNGRGSAIAM